MIIIEKERNNKKRQNKVRNKEKEGEKGREQYIFEHVQSIFLKF